MQEDACSKEVASTSSNIHCVSSMIPRTKEWLVGYIMCFITCLVIASTPIGFFKNWRN